ncbi:ABC transporter permease subunit [bacterium]|nr:ABC transporter permease subunit [bacterium]
MRNTWIIFRRELRSYFSSPLAYAVMAGFLLIAGFFFYAILTSFLNTALRSEMQAQYYRMAPPPINVNLMALRPFFHNLAVVLIFTVPLITMRLYAEEFRNGTIELLMTSPVRNWETVLGKALAAFVLYASLIAGTLVYAAILFLSGKPEPGQIITSYIGLLLLGGAFVAVGIFLSTLTENQIVAGFLTIILLLLFWVVGWADEFAGPGVGSVLAYVSLLSHFDEFAKGVIDLKDVVLYLSFIGFFLFLTHLSLESKRWRTR